MAPLYPRGPWFEHKWIHNTRECFYKNLSFSDQIVLRGRFLKNSKLFPLYRKRGPSIEKKMNPLPPVILCAKLGWNLPSGSWEEDQNVKSLQRQRQTKDKSWSKKLTWAFRSGALKIYNTNDIYTKEIENYRIKMKIMQLENYRIQIEIKQYKWKNTEFKWKLYNTNKKFIKYNWKFIQYKWRRSNIATFGMP